MCQPTLQLAVCGHHARTEVDCLQIIQIATLSVIKGKLYVQNIEHYLLFKEMSEAMFPLMCAAAQPVSSLENAVQQVLLNN